MPRLIENSNCPYSIQELYSILEHAPVGLIVTLSNGSIEYINPALLNMLGYTKEEITDKNVVMTHPDDIAINQHIRRSLRENPNQAVTIDKRYIHKNGHILSARLSISAQLNESDHIARFIGHVIDIEKEKKITRSASLFRSMIDASRESMMIIKINTGQLLDCNTHCCKSLGYTQEELLSLSISDIDRQMLTPHNWERVMTKIRRQKNIILHSQLRRKDKSSFDAEVSINHVILDDEEYILSISRDITRRKENEHLIWEQANYDPLTRLANRHRFYKKLKQALHNAQKSQKKVAVLCLDLDRFKEVNDTLGHSVGDKLLIATGNRIKQCIRDIDTIARLGGDEFCIIIDNIQDKTHTDRVSTSILDNLSKAFIIDGHKIFISTSIGISFYPDDADDDASLFRHADQAMFYSKERGRNGFKHFTKSMQEHAVNRMQLSRDLHLAIKEQQFYMVYQPIVSLDDQRIVKAEALIRWNHPKRGLVSPEEFISIAEENGTIEPIGDWVFSQTLQALKQWRNNLQPDLQVGINVSPLYFRQGNDQLAHWQKDIHDEGIPSEAFVFEITEGLLMESSENVSEILLGLRDAGIQVALDDFGTGYSSLSYLKKLDIDYLKIDKSFVDNLAPDTNEEALCEAIIVMAHKLKLKVIAEGIETEEQYQLLRSFGCDYGQGYLFSRPLEQAVFTQRLSQQSKIR